jgi:hypothetical protein
MNFRYLAILVFSTCTLAVPLSAQSEPSPNEIMQGNFFSSKPKQLLLHQEMTMTLMNDRGETRQRTITSLSALQANGIDSRIMVRFLAPSDVKGTAFLQIEHSEGDDDQWIFLPALHKSRRLVSSNRKDSFIGSDFAYGDVIQPKVSLYQHKLLREETFDGQPCYVIESVPATDDIKRDYGYGKKVTWISQGNYFDVKTVYYDVTGRLLKTQMAKNLVKADSSANSWLAQYKEMFNHQTNHKTIVTVERYRAETIVAPDTFTLRALEKD